MSNSKDFEKGIHQIRNTEFYRKHGRKVQRTFSGLYRSRNGILLGVCAGIAKKFSVSTSLVRAAFIVFTIMTGIWIGALIYLALGILLDVEPETGVDYSNPKRTKLNHLLERSERLAKRVENLETIITKDDKKWEDRLYKS